MNYSSSNNFIFSNFTDHFNESFPQLEDSMKNVTNFHFRGYHFDNTHNLLQVVKFLPKKLTKICLYGHFERCSYLYKFIKENTNSLKEICFYKTNINYHYLCLLFDQEDLNLKSVHFKHCLYVTDAAVLRLCESQKQVEELILESCPKITDDSIASITKFLTNLKTFKATDCFGITEVGKFSFELGFT